MKGQLRREEKPLFKKRLSIVLSSAFVLLSSQFLFSADFQVSAALDRPQLALNEQAVLSVTITGTGNLPEPQLPALPDFQISNAGRAQNFSWINGQASASVTYSYALLALKEGHFTIPPVKVQAQGQAAETPPLTLDVVKGDPGAVSAAPESPGSRRPTQNRGAAALFITGTVDKTSVFVGEPVTYIFRLYNRVALLSRPNYQPPETPGFWAEDLPPQRTYTTQIKGVPYNVTEVRTALFPTSPGTAHVGSAQLGVHLENLGTDPFSNDFFASFFGRGEEKVLRTDPVAIRVKALPDPKPANFKGAVGHFTLSSNMDKETASVGQPLTLTVTVAGRGNIKSLPDLPLPPLTNFRTFDANAATNIEKKEGLVQGSKVFKTVLIPTASGELHIPALSFVYFDPDSREYKTASSRPFTVHTLSAGVANNGNATATYNSPTTAPGIQMLGEDIRYIKTPSRVQSDGGPLYRNRLFLAFHAVLLAGVLGSGLFAGYRRLFHSNQVLARFKNAKAETDRLIFQAEEGITRGEIKRSSEILADALHSYLVAKLALDERELSLKSALENLRGRGMLPHDTEKVRNLWETLDLFQFAPTQVRADELRKTILTLKHVIEEVEKDILWKE